MASVADIFDKYKNQLIYIEETFRGGNKYTHLCFGYKDKEKKLIHLATSPDSSWGTTIDGRQLAKFDDTREWMLCVDENDCDIQLRFFVGTPVEFSD